ncbi:hypothetical protein C2S51_001715 [Perilla frutescens var. frutescens]|nr:hypothetical protein C2S51_001715 [Perilla frutescens var. frutescens]
MAFAIKIPIFAFFLFMNLLPSALSAPILFPCFFIFGDSLVDSGNNNMLNTSARANYWPYGIDFPQGPTGRFTNGRTTADFLGDHLPPSHVLAEMLGFDSFIPPFAGAQGGDIINGVNYASGSAGIRSETGEQLVYLDRQLQNHNMTISRFRRLLGNTTSTKDRLNKCLYYFVAGSNDYINNYYLPEYYPSSTLYTPDQYATVLIDQYSQQLKKLYDFGARKISVSGLGPLGCIPAMLSRGGNGSPCVDSINNAVALFNDKLKILVDDLNNDFTDAKFIYIGAMDLRPPALFAPGQFELKLISNIIENIISLLSAPSLFPCYFIFGDSLVDNGNNNGFNTSAKANYSPYGVDFPQGPTGRFTNGRTTADYHAEMLGFDGPIPPFVGAQGDDIINGVNYASAASGIRSETGQQVVINCLNQQLRNHNVTISHLARLLGSRHSVKEHLNKCLYSFFVGSNDYISNYYLPQYYNTSKLYTLDQYATVLIQQYSQQLKRLYNFGARKISVSGLGQLGCIPAILARGTNGSHCVDVINHAAALFNDRLKLLVIGLNNNLTNAEFIYIGGMADLSPTVLSAHGIRHMSRPCCKMSSTTGLCTRGETPCPVRDVHVFYDYFHPTQIVNKIVANASYIEILKLIS